MFWEAKLQRVQKGVDLAELAHVDRRAVATGALWQHVEVIGRAEVDRRSPRGRYFLQLLRCLGNRCVALHSQECSRIWPFIRLRRLLLPANERRMLHIDCCSIVKVLQRW